MANSASAAATVITAAVHIDRRVIAFVASSFFFRALVPSWSCLSWSAANLRICQCYCFIARFPIAHSAAVVRMKICPSEIAGELSV